MTIVEKRTDMVDEKQDEALTKRIEEGQYFQDARDWYDHVYIGPISQRIFFIIVTVISVLVFFMSVTSVLNLLPLSPRVPFVYRADDMMNEIPQMIRFKEPQEDANPALVRYYLSTYVRMRESYNARQFLKHQAFVRQYSEPQEYNEYSAEISQNNPQSPIRRYGQYRDVKVEVKAVRYNREQLPYTATVDFSTIVIGKEQEQKTDWTAAITFDYTDLTVRNTYDDSIDDYVLDYDEPTFRVINYETRERLSPIRR